MERRYNKRIARAARSARVIVISGVIFGAVSGETSWAQAPKPTAPPAAGKGPAATGTAVQANLSQLMKGILYPSSNVIFAAQSTNPAEVAPAKDPATATDPLLSAYGKWEAVENSGLARMRRAC